jgi:uncharacterized membrane protein HdeD (DUF308 family)
MTNLRREARRLAIGFVLSGSLTLGLGCLALALPESTLIAGMLAVGLISVLFGLNQIFSALSLRARAPMWRFLLTYGVLTLAFGLLTVGATALTLTMAVGFITAWLAFRGIFALTVAFRVRPAKWIRYSLFGSATIDLLGAALIVAIPAFTIFQYLFFGAVYAVVLGASQLAAGAALRGIRFEDTPTVAAVWS